MSLTSLQTAIHNRLALNRRLEVLSRELSAIIPDQSTVLDVGAGSGEIAKRIQHNKSTIEFAGIDVVVREDASIPVRHYDGKTIPFEDKRFDYVMLIDMLHHTDSPGAMMREAKRVANKGLIIKDHNVNTKIARRIIGFTDWFANAQYGVPMTYNYLSRQAWQQQWEDLELTPTSYTDNFGLYPFYSYLIFARDQDFICLLDCGDQP